jgi:hypothetical protein
MRSMRVALGVAGVLLLALLDTAPAAQQGGPPAKADWRGTGTVVAVLPPPSSLHATRPVIIIHHGPIHGLMEETMDMPFIAASVDLFRGLHAGDRIAFALRDTPDALLVVAIERLAPR